MRLMLMNVLGNQFSLFLILLPLKTTAGKPVTSMIDLFVPAKLPSMMLLLIVTPGRVAEVLATGAIGKLSGVDQVPVPAVRIDSLR